MLKRVSIIILLSMLIIIFISESAVANPVATPISDFVCFMFFSLIIINFPLNSMFYSLFLLFRLFGKDRNEFVRLHPNSFIIEIFVVTFLATFLGAIIDSFLFQGLETDLYLINFNQFILIGLVLIFLSYLTLIIYIQRLKFIDAVLISIGIAIVNGLFWSIFVSSPPGLLNLIGIMFSFGLIGLAIVIPALYKWYSQLFDTVRQEKLKELELKKELFDETENILVTIPKARFLIKHVSIIFTNRRVLVTKKEIEPRLDELLKEENLIYLIPYMEIYYIRFKLAFSENKLQIKYRNWYGNFYCNRKTMINAKRVLDKHIEPLIVM